MAPKPHIFVSYARSDGKDTAWTIRNRLQNDHKLTLWHDLADMEGGRDWWHQITEAIDQVEHVVLVMTPNALKSSIVRREWRYARQRGRSVTPVMGSPDLAFDDLPGWMRSHAFVEWWEPEAWTRLVRGLEAEGKIPRVPFMADDLPENFVPRPNELEELIGTLSDENRAEPVAITAALRGAGGYGKTTLARAICHDDTIQDAFFDGVLWVTLGEDPGELIGRVIDLIHTLTGEREAFETIDAAVNRFKELLADRHMLLVIDDVWNHAHLRPFSEGGPNCVRLITTRFATAIPENARRTQVDAMQVDEAIDLLRPEAPHGAVDPLKDLVQRLGEWPLLLKLAGAMLRRREHLGNSLGDALLWVNKSLDRRGVTAFDARDAEQRDQAVSKTLDVSFDQLNDNERRLFADLAVFSEDVKIPLATLEVLWDLDDFDTEEHCQHFFEAGLLWSLDLIERRLRLHDVIRAYLRPPDIDLQSLDAKLVEAYRERCGGLWHSVPDDGYMLDWLPSHLFGAGQYDEVRDLVFDLSWLQRKLSARGANALVADAMLIRDDDETEQLSRALRMSAHVLNRQPAQLTTQLIGRLHLDKGGRTEHLIKQATALIPDNILVPLGGRHLLAPGSLIRTFQGHRVTVRDTVLLDDGQRTLSWSYDNTLRLWELNTGESRALEGHSDSVNGAVVLDNGQRALSWSDDNTLRLWELNTGESRIFEGHGDAALGAMLLDDGHHVLSWSKDSTLRIWDLDTGENRVLKGHSGSVIGAVLLDDGKRALSWSWDKTLHLWELNTGESRILEGHSDRVNSAVLLDDGQRALSWSDDNTLRLWELNTGESRALEGHSDSVNGVVLLDGGQRALSWSWDKTLRIWDLNTGKSRALEGHSGAVKGVVLLDDSALSWAADGTLRTWNLDTGESRPLKGHSRSINGVILLNDDQRALSWSWDKTLRIWDLNTGKSRAVEGHSDSVTGAVLLDDSALSWAADSTLRIWDLGADEGESNEGRHRDSVNGAVVLDKGQHSLSWSNDNTLRLWELNTGESRILEGHSDRVNSAVLLDDGQRALSWSYDNTLRLWELNTGESRALEGHNESVNGAVLLDDGQCALSWSYDNTLRLWELNTGESRALEGHNESVNGAVLLDDGQRALSWSVDDTLRIWELETEGSSALEGHSDSIRGALLLEDGKRALSWADDNTLRLWELETGESSALTGHRGSVIGAVLLDDGQRALSWSNDDTLRIWNLNTGKSRIFEGHDSSVIGAMLLDDDHHAFSWALDNTLRIWKLEQLEEVMRFVGDDPLITCVISRDGRLAVAGDSRGRVMRFALPAYGRAKSDANLNSRRQIQRRAPLT